MKKLKKLNLQLENLESQKQKYKSLENISISQFIKFKSIISKQKKISNHIERCISLGKKINFWYDSKNNSWIKNPNISSRKYFRLEKHAAYKKDRKLYKLGFTDKKPLHPFIQNLINSAISVHEKLSPVINKITSKFPKPDLSKFILFRKIKNKYNNFTSITLPQKINNVAVSTAKIGIKGYRSMQSNCRFIRNTFKSKKSFKYIQNVINEANKQISLTEKQQLFRESLKVPQNAIISKNKSYTESPRNKINLSKSSQTLSKDIYEYSL